VSKKNIVIVGYPKSGTTWLTRLTAELIGCPVEGYWGRPNHDEPAIEGESRTSEYRCYKSHHPLEELGQASGKPIHSVLYIARDPRDIIVSGSRFFDPARSEWVDKHIVDRVLRRIPGAVDLYKRIFRSWSYRKHRVLKAVIYGDSRLSWAQLPWDMHVHQYLKTDHLFVRYEDLRESTHQQCIRILDHLGLERTDEHIEKSIYRQSLDVKKKELVRRGEEEKTRVMNKGIQRQWQGELSEDQVREVEEGVEVLMDELSYERHFA
jgi:hypothetical protein